MVPRADGCRRLWRHAGARGLWGATLLRSPLRRVGTATSVPARDDRRLGAAPAASASQQPAAWSGLSEWAGVYMELAKYRLSGLVALTTSAGYAMAGPPLDAGVLVPTLAGTFLASACANTLNQVYEVDRDMRMKRTQRRPLPSGRISSAHALAFGVGSGSVGIGLLATCANPLTAALGVGNIALYAAVYTPLKVRTPLNTVVGAVVGALPPLMGWAAATGSVYGAEPLALGATLFLWQMPHFYALAWLYRTDYAAGGYRMLPLYDPSGARTAAHCLGYALALAAVPVYTAAAGTTSPMFAVESVVFNGALVALALRFREAKSQAAARRLFLGSLVHLPIMLGLMVFHGSRLRDDATEGDGSDARAPEGIVSRARDIGRKLCMHNRMCTSPEGGLPAACPAVVSEAARTETAVDALAKAAGLSPR